MLEMSKVVANAVRNFYLPNIQGMRCSGLVAATGHGKITVGLDARLVVPFH